MLCLLKWPKSIALIKRISLCRSVREPCQTEIYKIWYLLARQKYTKYGIYLPDRNIQNMVFTYTGKISRIIEDLCRPLWRTCRTISCALGIGNSGSGSLFIEIKPIQRNKNHVYFTEINRINIKLIQLVDLYFLFWISSRNSFLQLNSINLREPSRIDVWTYISSLCWSCNIYEVYRRTLTIVQKFHTRIIYITLESWFPPHFLLLLLLLLLLFLILLILLIYKTLVRIYAFFIVMHHEIQRHHISDINVFWRWIGSFKLIFCF